MAVQNIEQYKMKNGMDILKVYTKPTKKFPNGACFYADAEEIDLVKNHTWWLNKKGNSIYVKSFIFPNNCRFHRELCFLQLGYYVACIDHVNGIGFDNITQNLNVVTNSQNKFNIFTKGYSYRNKDSSFQSSICLNSKIYYPFSIVRREDEICIQRNDVEQNWLKEQMQDDYYMFDFKKYRRGSEDILDLERTGVISEDEAVY